MADHRSPRHGGGAGGERHGAAETTTDGSATGTAGTAPVDDWADRLRVDAAALLRRREAWLRRQSADDASLGGVLVDHAENGSLVALTTAAGRRHLGRVRGAGAEVVVLHVGTTRVLVTLEAVATVQAVDEGRPTVAPVGHRVGDDPTTLADLLSHAVAERPAVSLVMWGGEVVAGALEAVGRDVAMVRPADRTPLIYARLSSVSEASLPLSTRSG